MVEKKKVAVIGAGVSGLAAAKAFKERGHAVTVIERSHALGGVWEPSRSYPDVQTQRPKDLYRYTGKPMQDHVTHIVVHGILHLLGYDHVRDKDATLMERTEVEILGKLGLPDPY